MSNVVHYFAIALMHLAQASTLSFLPVSKRAHCKFGYFLNFWVGLYLPLSLTKVQDIPDFFLQIEQIFEATFVNLKFEIYNLLDP